MNGSVEEWVAKANGDFDVAQLVFRADFRPNYDAVCFHCQQCVEKLLKALLLHRDMKPARVHDLVVLSDQVRTLVPSWSPTEKELRFLTQGAALFRYPGESATREKAEVALAICARLREALLKLIDERNAPST